MQAVFGAAMLAAPLVGVLARGVRQRCDDVPGDARSKTSPMIGEGHAGNAARIAATWYLLFP